MKRITLHNRQRRHRIDRGTLQQLALQLLQQHEARYRQLADLTLEIMLMGDRGAAALNRAALGHAGPTDVIALRYAAIPGIEEAASADVMLNVERAWQLGGGTIERADRELALYLAHAIDHLAGHNDDTPAAARAMRRREWRWLSRTGVPALFKRS